MIKLNKAMTVKNIPITYTNKHIEIVLFYLLARLRRPPAAFFTNGAITRGASGTKTFNWSCLSHMQSLVKIGGRVFEL